MPQTSPLSRTVRDTLLVFAPPVVVLTAHMIRVFAAPERIAFDMLMHFLGGASIAASALLFGLVLHRRGGLTPLPQPWLLALAVFGTVALVGIFWEFFEFTTDYAAHTNAQGGLKDTIADLALDLLGGIAMLLVAPWLGTYMGRRLDGGKRS